MESKRTPYVGAELDVIMLKTIDIVTTSDPTGDSLDWVDKDPNSWDT